MNELWPPNRLDHLHCCPCILVVIDRHYNKYINQEKQIKTNQAFHEKRMNYDHHMTTKSTWTHAFLPMHVGGHRSPLQLQHQVWIANNHQIRHSMENEWTMTTKQTGTQSLLPIHFGGHRSPLQQLHYLWIVNNHQIKYSVENEWTMTTK